MEGGGWRGRVEAVEEREKRENDKCLQKKETGA